MLKQELITTLRCDGKGCKADCVGTKPPDEVWPMAVRWGWMFVGERHLCPKCVAKEKIRLNVVAP